MRVPARFSVIVLVALCALAAIGVARLLSPLARPVRIAATAALALAMIAEGWAAPMALASFDPRGRPSDRTAYRWLSQQPPGAAIELPIAEWSIAPTLTYQYATLVHRHPIVNGYSGYNSPLQEFLGGAASPLNDLEHIGDALDLLRNLGVRYVLVHPRDYDDAAVGQATATALAAQPAMAAEAFRSADVVAFSLTDMPPPPPPDPGVSAGVRLGPADFRATASDAIERLPLAFDGDGDTRWLTGRPQQGDEWIRLEFDRPRNLSRIELQTAARSFGDYPRELRIESTAADGTTTGTGERTDADPLRSRARDRSGAAVADHRAAAGTDPRADHSSNRPDAALVLGGTRIGHLRALALRLVPILIGEGVAHATVEQDQGPFTIRVR